MEKPVPVTVKQLAVKIVGMTQASGQRGIDELRDAYDAYKQACESNGVTSEEGQALLNKLREERRSQQGTAR